MYVTYIQWTVRARVQVWCPSRSSSSWRTGSRRTRPTTGCSRPSGPTCSSAPFHVRAPPDPCPVSLPVQCHPDSVLCPLFAVHSHLYPCFSLLSADLLPHCHSPKHNGSHSHITLIRRASVRASERTEARSFARAAHVSPPSAAVPIPFPSHPVPCRAVRSVRGLSSCRAARLS